MKSDPRPCGLSIAHNQVLSTNWHIQNLSCSDSTLGLMPTWRTSTIKRWVKEHFWNWDYLLLRELGHGWHATAELEQLRLRQLAAMHTPGCLTDDCGNQVCIKHGWNASSCSKLWLEYATQIHIYVWLVRCLQLIRFKGWRVLTATCVLLINCYLAERTILAISALLNNSR
jgi:hypothetical protein